MEKIDLHIHTNVSDGKYTFKEIVDMAIKNNVTTISITDHDNIGAYTKENIEYAKSKNINLIYGVEISTKINRCGIHVLGYNIDLNNKELIDKLYLSRNSRHIYLREVAEVLIELGYVVNVEELDKIESVTKAHIAQDVVSNHKNKELLMKEFGFVPDKGMFIETLMNEGEKAYVEKKTLSPKEASDIIKQAGGKVVLAHPVAYTYEDNLTEKDIERIIDDMNPDGLESFYIYVDRNNRVINDIDRWTKFAKENNLFMTIGSDFHQDDGIRPEVGLINVLIDKELPDANKILEDLNKK
jgi:hypothetical protein